MSDRPTSSSRWQFMLTIMATTFGLAGCGKPANMANANDTGAMNTINSFAEGMVAQNWAEMYSQLEPASKQRLNSDQFAALAKRARAKIGFEPEAVRIQSCEEHGDQAISHLVYSTKSGPHKRRYLDGITARRVDGIWLITLPANFGK